MLSSTLDCRLPCSFYSSPFIWVKLEQVANSTLNFEAVRVLGSVHTIDFFCIDAIVSI